MNPDQQDNSFGGQTDMPTPEATPPTPEQTPMPEVAPPESPIVNTTPTGIPEQPVNVVQPAEQTISTAPEIAPVDSAAISPAGPEPASTPEVAPTPVAAPASPTQPVVAGGIGSATSMPADTPPKSKKGLIIGLIAGVGGLVIIGVVVILFLFVFNGGQIKNFAEFKKALEDRKAVNCTATISQSGIEAEMTIQANDGWSKVHMAAPSMMNMEMWVIKDGSEYTTYATALGQYYKSTQSNVELGSFDSDSLSEDDVKDLKCKPNNQADFTVPDHDWQESGSSLF
jgi:hypothetical protein